MSSATSPTPPRYLFPALFLISATGIAYQISLMRIWSIGQWHHFAYMMISIAMLGYGAGGTLLTLIRDRLHQKEREVFFLSLLALIASMPLCYKVAQAIPFETFHLVTQGDQWGPLAALYLTLAVPFFLASISVTLAFFMCPRRIGRVYFVDLLGSGVGAMGVIGALFVWSPEYLPYLLPIPLAALAVAMAFELSRRIRAVALIGLVGVGGFVSANGVEPVRISPYKVLSYTLQFPDAEVVAQANSPLARVELVRSTMIRETPGQLGNYPFSRLGPLPEQAGLFFDGGAVSVVNAFDGDPQRLAFLDYVTPALAYRVVDSPEVLVIGAGGGTDVLMALYHGARHVTAVEVDPSVFPLIRQELADFSGNWLERDDVTPVIAEGRGYFKRQGGSYDVIQIALLDAFAAAASGVFALSESYLYTREAIVQYASHLNESGVLAITRWLKTPPRDAIKMFATLVEGAEALGIENPGDHLAVIRSWNAATLLFSRSPWTTEQLQAIRDFSESRGFDIDWLPGLSAEDVNRFTILESPVYYEAALAILSPERQRFYDEYLFDVRPATDDRPYFFQFFKWNTLPVLIRDMGFEWLPFIEWGYVALWATIVQGFVASIVLILLPLVVLSKRAETTGKRRWVIAYFTALGLAFMFVEIAFIQRFMLFLNYPVYAVAVVLAAFLVFSGIGSFFADRWAGSRARLMAFAVGWIAVLSLGYVVGLPFLFEYGGGWSDAVRIPLSILLIAPLAFAMGIPFPCGLQHLSNRYPAMVPWAWGINGFSSVMGASLATLIAIHGGFRFLIGLAVLIYLLAVPALFRLYRGDGDVA